MQRSSTDWGPMHLPQVQRSRRCSPRRLIQSRCGETSASSKSCSSSSIVSLDSCIRGACEACPPCSLEAALTAPQDIAAKSIHRANLDPLPGHGQGWGNTGHPKVRKFLLGLRRYSAAAQASLQVDARPWPASITTCCDVGGLDIKTKTPPALNLAVRRRAHDALAPGAVRRLPPGSPQYSGRCIFHST